MSTRHRLPNRHASETFDLEAQGLKFTATISRFPDGSIAEIFCRNARPAPWPAPMDAAVLASIALQHGVPLDMIRRAHA
jgi:hypothetical protein